MQKIASKDFTTFSAKLFYFLLKNHRHYTHRNFVGALNLLWGLGQPNSDLVELTKILVGLTLIFGYTNQKVMRVEETKFLVSTTKILVGATNFFCSITNFLVSNIKFDSSDQKNLVAPTKILVVLTKDLVASTLIIFWLVYPKMSFSLTKILVNTTKLLFGCHKPHKKLEAPKKFLWVFYLYVWLDLVT